ASVGGTVLDWSGGTKIGDALAAWNRQWSRRLARGGPVALVLSDGWDCGDPELLAREAGRLSRSVHRLIWLNPLAARQDYRPETRGMKAVLPHIDRLLPAASVDDLAGLVSLLDTMAMNSPSYAPLRLATVFDIALPVTACLRSGTRADVGWVVSVDGVPLEDPNRAVAFTPGGGRLGGIDTSVIDAALSEHAGVGTTGRLVEAEISEVDALIAG